MTTAEFDGVALDLDAVPEMEVVKEAGDLELDDADTSAESCSIDTESSGLSQIKESPAMPRSNFRRTRGLSFLPIKSVSDTTNTTLKVASPPQTPSPLRPLGRTDDLHSNSPATSSNTSLFQAKSPLVGVGSTPERSTGSTDNTSKNAEKATKNLPMVDENQQLLSTYFSQLASKEARLSTIRAHLTSLQQELKDAENDMMEFKKNGAKLAQLVNDAHDFNSMRSSTPSSKGSNNVPFNRRPSTSSNSSTHTNTQDDAQKDVIGMGRRVVGEINTQFWAFLDDVKSATMGNVDFDQRNDAHNAEKAPELPPRRSPSPHRQLSTKRSIQDFMRSHSPTRESLRGLRSNSPTRQERKEHAAQQDQRSSERLSRKLSHIDLRAPPTPKRPSSPVQLSNNDN